MEIETAMKELELAFKESKLASENEDKAKVAKTKAHKRLQLALAEINSLRFN